MTLIERLKHCDVPIDLPSFGHALSLLVSSGSPEDNEREVRDSKIDRKAAIAATKAKRNK